MKKWLFSVTMAAIAIALPCTASAQDSQQGANWETSAQDSQRVANWESAAQNSSHRLNRQRPVQSKYGRLEFR